MKNFKQLKIWQKGFEIVINSFKLVQDFPKEERYNLSSQITRAAVSIPSNIAEGSSRTSEKDYKRFLEISLDSAFELETHILIANTVNYGDIELKNLILRDLAIEQKMIHSFISKLE